MLNAALRTSQQRVLGTAILQWDMFSLDVCHVLQFYREVLAEPISHNNSLIILDHPWSSLIILDHPWSSLIILGIILYILDIIWNLDIFLETFGYFWYILEICWRSIIRVSSVIINYIQQICTILTFQYLTKAVFSGLQTIKVTFFILHHFPIVSPRCVSPLCFPFLSPRCVSPVCLTVFGSKSWDGLSAFPLKKSKRMETKWNKTKQSDFQDLSGIVHQSIKLKGLAVNTWSLWAL